MADDEDIDIVVASAAFLIYCDDDKSDDESTQSKRRRVRCPRRFWVHDILQQREVSTIKYFT